jgi:hypothetical protein|tara:strand:- start:705 stop:998 length:294 start_codon:yes stop_codon:yes gene_type:complete
MTEKTFMKPEDIQPGKSYGCKFKVETMLDDFGRPAPNLSDVPLKGPGMYEGFGLITTRDSEKKLFKVEDTNCNKTFIVAWDQTWDIDEAEIVDSDNK